MDTKAIADAIKPVVESAVETRTAPLLKRIEDLETKGRERPALDVSEDGKNWTAAPVAKTGSYGGKISIPGIETKKFSFYRLLTAMLAKKSGAADPWAKSGYEQDVFKEVAKQRAAASLGNDSSAGFLIPNEVMSDIIENLRATSIMDKIGVQMMTGLTSSPVHIRRRTASHTGYWVGENASITASEPTYDRIALTPKKCAVFSDMSGDLYRKDPALVESEIRRDIALTLKLKQETGFFEGTGAAGQPTGLSGISGNTTFGVATSSTITTHDSTEVAGWIQALETMAVNNVNMDGCCWVMHARAWFQICSLLNSNVANTSTFGAPPVVSMGAPNVQGSIQAALVPQLFGFPVYICNSLTASTTTKVYFLHPSDLIWATWGNPEIALSDQAGNAFQYDQVFVRILQECDVNARHPEAICYTTYTY